MSPPVVEQIVTSMKCIMGEDGTTIGEWYDRISLLVVFMDLCIMNHTTPSDCYTHGGGRVQVEAPFQCFCSGFVTGFRQF